MCTQTFWLVARASVCECGIHCMHVQRLTHVRARYFFHTHTHTRQPPSSASSAQPAFLWRDTHRPSARTRRMSARTRRMSARTHATAPVKRRQTCTGSGSPPCRIDQLHSPLVCGKLRDVEEQNCIFPNKIEKSLYRYLKGCDLVLARISVNPYPY